MDKDDKVCAYTLPSGSAVEAPKPGCCLSLVDKENPGSDGATGMQSHSLNQRSRVPQTTWDSILISDYERL